MLQADASGWGRHRGHGVLILLAGPDAIDALDGQDHDLAVAHFAGAGGAEDGVDGWLDEVVRDADLE
jgi:hypothetical protein